MVLTDTHAGNWNAASSGTLATRRYQFQNVGGWRADVVATTIDNGDPYEYIRYSPYGIPTSYPAADANRNGVTNGTDTTDMIAVLGGGSAAVVCHIDLNKDGLYPDTADIDYCNDESALTGKRGGFNKLGTATGSVAPRFGYAGYAWDPAVKVYHVRHRVYSPEVGRWLTRDPIGYANSNSLVQYSGSAPTGYNDPSGLIPVCFCQTCLGWAVPVSSIQISNKKFIGTCPKQITDIEDYIWGLLVMPAIRQNVDFCSGQTLNSYCGMCPAMSYCDATPYLLIDSFSDYYSYTPISGCTVYFDISFSVEIHLRGGWCRSQPIPNADDPGPGRRLAGEKYD